MGRYVRLDVTYSGVKHDHMSLLILHTCSMTTLASPPTPPTVYLPLLIPPAPYHLSLFACHVSGSVQGSDLRSGQ